MEVVAHAGEPILTFDGCLVHLAGLDAVPALAHGMALGHDQPVFVRSRTDLLLEGAAAVGSIVAHAAIRRGSDGYRCQIQLEEARVAMEVGESITAIEARTVQAVRLGSSVAPFSTAMLSTSRARELAAATTTVLVGCESGPQTSLQMAAVRRRR